MTGMSAVKPTVATLYVQMTEMAGKIEELTRAVIGYNGTPGIVAEIPNIRNRVECLENINKENKGKEEENKKENINWIKWFFEKWFAPVVTAVVIGLIMKYFK